MAVKRDGSLSCLESKDLQYDRRRVGLEIRWVEIEQEYNYRAPRGSLVDDRVTGCNR